MSLIAFEPQSGGSAMSPSAYGLWVQVSWLEENKNVSAQKDLVLIIQ